MKRKQTYLTNLYSFSRPDFTSLPPIVSPPLSTQGLHVYLRHHDRIDRLDRRPLNASRTNIPHMSANRAESTSTGVSSWLSTLPPHSDTDPNSEPPSSQSPSNLTAGACSPLTFALTPTRLRSPKRKRKLEDQDQDRDFTNTPTSRKLLCNEFGLTRRALTEIEANMAPGQATPNKVRDCN